jgi:glycosyltransferase involved in cell wall biosynthesis
MKDFVGEYIIGIDESTDDNTGEEVFRFLSQSVKMPKYEKGKEYSLRNSSGDKIFHIYPFKWQDDFSKARNEGMDKATGKYILIMDGHEYFPQEWFSLTKQQTVYPQRAMPLVIEDLVSRDDDEGFLELYQQPFRGMIPANYFLQPRIYRNDTKIRYNRAAHNTITNTNPEKSAHYMDVILVHDAPEDNRVTRKKQRKKMNVEEIEKAIKKNPKDTRSYFYLGNTYQEQKNFKKAIQSFDKYLKYRADDTSEKYQVYIHKALCYQQMENWRKVRDCLYLAKAIDPLRRDAYRLTGDMYIIQKDYEKAIFEYTTMLNLKPQPSRMFQDGASNSYDGHQKLAKCYIEVGRIPEAVVHLKHAIKYFPNPAWIEMVQKLEGGKKNILIIDHIGSFTQPIYDYFASKQDKYNVVMSKQYNNRLVRWADTIWCEWGDQNAYLCSVNAPQKTVIRVHGYEAYNPTWWKKIQWNECKRIVFVAKHIKDKMINVCGIKEEKCQIIHNGVDVDKFYIKNDKRDGNKVGYAGFINEKKNPYRLLQLIKKSPGLKFHLRIDHQSAYWKDTFDYELKDCKNVVYHGRYKDLSDFWNKMDYVVSTSIIESFSYNIAEAMACGCFPVVYNWKGADEFWGDYIVDENIVSPSPFDDFWHKTDDEKKELMLKYRKHIVDNFNQKDRLKDIEILLVGVANELASQAKQPE